MPTIGTGLAGGNAAVATEAGVYPKPTPAGRSGFFGPSPNVGARTDPSAISGLVVRLRADDIAQADLSAVASWTDLVSGLVFAQGTGANQPVYRTNQLNGHASVVFDGLATYLIGPAGSLSLLNAKPGCTIVTIAADARGPLNSNGGVGLANRKTVDISNGTSAANTRAAQEHRGVATNLFQQAVAGRRLDADAAQQTQSGVLVNSQPHVEATVWDYTNAQARIVIDGVVVLAPVTFQTAGSTSATNSLSFTIGAQGSVTQFWEGPLYEVLVWDRALTAAELAQVDSYGQDTYAITVADYVTDSAGGGSAAVATGTLTLSGSATPTAASAAAGSITLAGAAGAQAPVTAAGSIALSGTTTATAPAVATGSLTLAGTATGVQSSSATGSLTLTGTATARSSATSTGSLTLAGSTTARAAATATGSLALAGTAAPAAPATSAGSLTLSGTAASRAAATAAGSLTLTGTTAATAPATTTGSITLGGTATGTQPGQQATGSITLAGTSTARVAASLTGVVTLGGAPTAAVTASTLGSLTLAANVTARAAIAGLGSITLGGTGTGVVGAITTPGQMYPRDTAGATMRPAQTSEPRMDPRTVTGPQMTGRAMAASTMKGG